MLMAVVVIEVFHLFFFCIGLLCESRYLGDGNSKISLLKRAPKWVCYLCVDEKGWHHHYMLVQGADLCLNTEHQTHSTLFAKHTSMA